MRTTWPGRAGRGPRGKVALPSPAIARTVATNILKADHLTELLSDEIGSENGFLNLSSVRDTVHRHPTFFSTRFYVSVCPQARVHEFHPPEYRAVPRSAKQGPCHPWIKLFSKHLSLTVSASQAQSTRGWSSLTGHHVRPIPTLAWRRVCNLAQPLFISWILVL